LGLKNAVVTVNDNKMIVPVEREGMKVLSIGMMLPSEDTPVIWRGALLMKAVQQFLFEVDWGELDYLVVDLPPGTGDVQLTIAQNIVVDGSVVVSTPQDVALADVKKAVAMFQELGIPITGLVENMAYFICPHCGKRSDIFGGSDRLEKYASEKGFDILAKVPIEPLVSELSDSGKPVVVAAPDSATAKAFMEMAKKISQKLPVG
jgi:ATP-binding protein involved in chromosome partitioning